MTNTEALSSEKAIPNVSAEGKKNANVPNLRFAEFDYGWLFKTIKDVSDVVGGGTPETDKEAYWNGNIQWFTPSEIGLTKYVSKSQRTITELGLNKSSAKLLPQGTLLLSTRATVGECSIAMNECTTNQGFQSLIPKNIVDRDFLYYLIQTKKHHLVKHACGSTFLEISNSEVKNLSVAIPHEKEQRKLGHFLSLIDERIATQSKIIEDLETCKKGIIDTCFCTNGLYSVGKEYKLKELLLEGNKTPIDTSQYKKITIKLHFGGIEFTEQGRTMKDTRPFYIRRKGELIIGKQNYFNGSIAIIDEQFDGSICSNAIMSFGIVQSCNPTFIYWAIANESYLKRRSFFANGTGQKELSETDFLNFSIRLPDQLEQAKFSNAISAIGKKIALEKHLLKKLKEQKKFLLSNMFI